MTMKTIDKSVNKVEGFEKADGIECARISRQHSGMRTMAVQSQGMDIFIKGPYTGTSECLFAVKEGYLVKLTSSTKMNGNLEITSKGMSMPIGIEMKSVSEVKSRRSQKLRKGVTEPTRGGWRPNPARGTEKVRVSGSMNILYKALFST